MPYRRKIHTKPGNAPVVIETLSEKLFSHFQERKVPYLVLLGGALLAIVAFFSYEVVSSRTERSARDMEYAAYSEYSKRNQSAGEEREKHIRQAADLYQKLVTTYPRSGAAAWGYFYLGNASIDLKEFDKGIEYYRKALSLPAEDGKFRSMVKFRLANAWLNKNNRDEAMKILREMEEDKSSVFRDSVSFEIGQILEKEGKVSEALGRYEAVVKEFPWSPVFTEANARIANLKGSLASPSPVSPGTAPEVPSKK